MKGLRGDPSAGMPVPMNVTLYVILKAWAIGIAAQQGQST